MPGCGDGFTLARFCLFGPDVASQLAPTLGSTKVKATFGYRKSRDAQGDMIKVRYGVERCLEGNGSFPLRAS